MSSPLEDFIRKKEDEPGNILFAVPKKGRLYEAVLEILKGAGLKYVRPPRLDVAKCKDIGVTIVFLPAADIAKYVGEGDVDIGITGIDIINESQVEVTVLERLGIGKCKLAVMAPIGRYTDVRQIAGKRIVTSFPNITRKFFEELDDETHVRYVSGSVEVACTLGLADAVVDLVETGTTMKAAGLEIVKTIMQTETVLIANPRSKNKAMVNKLQKRIKGYLVSQHASLMAYNIEKSKLDLARAITPGHESPTIANLEDPDWVSVTVLVSSDEVASVMDRLSEIGAKSIIVFNVSNCRM